MLDGELEVDKVRVTETVKLGLREIVGEKVEVGLTLPLPLLL